MYIIQLLEITLLFSGGTWACPKKTLPSCGLCPDNTFYGTDLCDEGDPRCSLIPASEAITYSIGSDGCKEVDMHCPKYSQLTIGSIPVDLFSNFKEAGGGVICNQNSIWDLALSGKSYPLTSLYCYNCSQCLDVRPPSAAECDASTPCLPATISYQQPEGGCRSIKVQCPDRPQGYTTTTYKFFYTNGATEMISTSSSPQLITLCGVQKAWVLYIDNFLGRKGDIDTIACYYS